MSVSVCVCACVRVCMHVCVCIHYILQLLLYCIVLLLKTDRGHSSVVTALEFKSEDPGFDPLVGQGEEYVSQPVVGSHKNAVHIHLASD